jgi:2',3'-cyclic-nucleotide 2'-phosphodiesterase / 3'-nucleotidase / 5'-nucleotidase
MGTTDVHGRIYNHDYYTGRETDHGLALLKPLVDSIRGVHGRRALLFDSGDLLQGNPLGLVYARVHADEPNPIIRAMNFMAYDAAAIGNHEFNYGLAHLQRAIDLAGFPFVSANIHRAGTNEHAYTPYVLIPVPASNGDTLVVGVTGNTPPGVHLWDRDNVTGILELREVTASVRDVVGEMRSRGADLIVVLSHGGLEGTSYDTVTTGLPPENQAAELAQQVPGIDVIFLGHTHRELADTTINGVLLTQARNWASSLAVVTVEARRSLTGAWNVERKHGQILRPRAGVRDREFLDSLRWEHERTVAYVNARVGQAAQRMDAREARVRDTPIIDFINEVQRRTAGADLSATAAFQIAAALPAGDITIADIAALYPYDNTLKAIRLSGAQLRAYLEKSAEYYNGWPATGSGTVTNFSVPGYNFDIISGVDYTLDISRPVGSRVTELRFNGAPVRDEQSFTMALNNYRQAGGGGYDMIAGAPVVYDRQQDVRELLIDEVRQRGVVRPADYFRESWQLVPAAAAATALQEQTAGEARARADTADAIGADAAGSGAAGRKRLRVLATNDFHGNLAALQPVWSDGRPVGGAAALATYFGLEAEAFPGPTILLDGGDVMQGTPVSNLTRGRATVEYYNAVGYAGAAIGNHEFDWGADVLQQRMEQADFPWLAANILVAGSDTSPSWVRPTAMIERAGVRVGLLGLITEETPTLVMAAHIAGFAFADGAAVMDRWVPELRRQGADFVIVVAHAGARCRNETQSCTDEIIEWVRRVRHRPDLVVAGHTHEIVRTRENGVAIVEAGSYGQRYGVVDLVRVTADSADVWIRGTPTPWADRVPGDSTIADIVTRAEAEVGPQLNAVIATAAENIVRGAGENPMGLLIADAQRAATGAQVALMNAGGVRAALPGGVVTWGDLFRVQPFGNMLIVMRLSGVTLRQALEHGVRGANPLVHMSGATADYDPAQPVGSRIRSIRLASGEMVDDDGIYTVSASDFMVTGGDGFTMFADAIDQTHTGVVDLDALIAHIQSLPQPFRAPTNARLHAVVADSRLPVP